MSVKNKRPGRISLLIALNLALATGGQRSVRLPVCDGVIKAPKITEKQPKENQTVRRRRKHWHTGPIRRLHKNPFCGMYQTSSCRDSAAFLRLSHVKIQSEVVA